MSGFLVLAAFILEVIYWAQRPQFALWFIALVLVTVSLLIGYAQPLYVQFTRRPPIK